jgi:hypothetical protein
MYILKERYFPPAERHAGVSYEYKVIDTESPDSYEAGLRLKYVGYAPITWPYRVPIFTDEKTYHPLDPLIWKFEAFPNPQFKGPPYTDKVVAEFLRRNASGQETVVAHQEFDRGNPVQPTSSNPGASVVRLAANQQIEVFNAYIVDRTHREDHGHSSWSVNPASALEMVRWVLDGVESTPRKTEHWMMNVVNMADPPIHKFRLHWVDSFPSAAIKKHELMVWLCLFKDSWHSSEARTFARNANANGATVQVGQTNTVLCEVWPDTLPNSLSPSSLGVTLGRLIFHEWMHAKIDVDDSSRDIHAHTYGMGHVPITEQSFADTELDCKPFAAGLYSKCWDFAQRKP